MPVMTSKVPHRYAGRPLGAGETFEAEEHHVRGLIALGRAEVREAASETVERTRAVTSTTKPKPARKRAS